MNLTADLSGLVSQLEPIARPRGQGRVLMVMGAGRGVGASTVARELARLSARSSDKGVWLFDLDFAGNQQSQAARCAGPVYDAGFGQAPFWSIAPAGARARIVAKRSAAPGLTVTEFQSAPGAVRSVGLRAAPDYWFAVRNSIDLAVLDAPPNSRAVLSLVQDMDGVILVADARRPNHEGLAARRAAIEARGGVVAGLILNRSGARRAA